MMKTLSLTIILNIMGAILFCPNAFAQKDEVFGQLSQKERELLTERLKLFGLLGLEKDRKRLERRRSLRASSVDLTKIIGPLQDHLKGDYLKRGQEELGVCSGGECLQGSSEGRMVFVDGEGNQHCYPNTTCEYYKCMEERYRCMDVGVEYFEKLAYPTCGAYVKNIKEGRFTTKGKEWIFNVMVCLQKGLFDECSLKGNCPVVENNQKTCEHITEFTLNFHPGCYIESGVGVCKLPLKDQINIWRTVGPYLTDRERIEAFKVVRYCAFGTPIN